MLSLNTGNEIESGFRGGGSSVGSEFVILFSSTIVADLIASLLLTSGSARPQVSN